MPTHDPCCDKTFVPGLCIMRHSASKQRILRGMSEREKCATCPQIMEYLEEIKMTGNKDEKTKSNCATNTGKLCSECGKESAFARELCKKCYSRAYYRRKNNGHDISKANPDEKKQDESTEKVDCLRPKQPENSPILVYVKNNPANEMNLADLEPKTPIAKVTMEMLFAENCSLMAMVDRLLGIVERQRKVMEAL